VAFRTKRRRKPRVVWLPTFGGLDTETALTTFQGVRGSIIFDGITDEVVYDAFPLTFDLSYDAANEQYAIPLGTARTLHDIVSGNEYRLRRIVGKAHIWTHGDELDSPAVQGGLVDVACGFIVCDTDDDGAPGTLFSEVNPLAQMSSEDPWIWRRRWILNPYWNATSRTVVDPLLNNFPYADIPGSTMRYGSAVDGPHIDQKTARRIGRSQRLFCVIAGRPLLLTPGSDYGAMTLQYQLDYRLLASMLRSSPGNRGRASR